LLAAQSLFDQAAEDYRQERFAEAAEKLRRVAKPGFDARFLLGAVLIRLDRAPEALPELEAALRLRPEHLDARKLLASEYLRLGRHAAAISLMRAHLRDEECYLLYLQAHHDRGELEDLTAALRLARTAAARYPRSARAHAYLGYALGESGHFAQARTHLERSFTLDPEDPLAPVLLAAVLLTQGDRAGALEGFTAAAARWPEFAEARLGRGRALAALERLEEAATELELAARMAPAMPRIPLELSKVYARLGRTEEAGRAAARFRELSGASVRKTP